MTIHLRSYQQTDVSAIRGAFAGNRAVLYVAPTGSGKCLGKGTPILMWDGHVRAVEHIKTGDILMGPDSRPRGVISTCIGHGLLYRVTPIKGEPYIVNEDHILCLQPTRKRIVPRYPSEEHSDNIVEITVRDYVGKTKWFKHLHKGVRTSASFGEWSEPLKISPYFLGLWLGDGLSRGSAVCNVDREITDYLYEYADELGMTVRKECSGDRPPIFHIVENDRAKGPGNNRLLQALRHYSLFNHKHIPLRFKTGSEDERLDVLAGIIDSDGHLGMRGDFELTLKNEELFSDVLFLARSLGFSCYKSEVQKTCGNNGVIGTYFRCNINGPLERIPCRVTRKRAPARRQKKNVLVTGIKVEPIGHGDYFGFELAGPDGRFLLGDFTITHNTVLFTYIAASLAARQRRAWILVHRQELLTQTSRALTEWGVDHALVSPQFSFVPHAALQVASVQTLVRRLDKLPAPDLIICDEAHHAVSPTYRTIIERHPVKLLGVTATPARLDGKGLGDMFSKMVIGPTVADLTRDGFLAPATVFAPPSQIDMQGVGKVAGDYARGETAARVDKPTITGDAVQHYTRICPGVPAIAFCVSVVHAEHVARDFAAAGYRAASVDGSMPDPQRRSLIQGLASGSVQVLTSCDLISEGLDIPSVTAAILLRPTYSLALARQQIGRALRPAAGKARAVILDHAGNVLRHGLPTEEIEWTLESGGRRKTGDGGKAVGVKQCAECFCAYPATADHCPECGTIPAKQPREVEQIAGDLVEFDAILADKRKAAARAEVGRAKTLDELKRIARERNYRYGWVLKMAQIKRISA